MNLLGPLILSLRAGVKRRLILCSLYAMMIVCGLNVENVVGLIYTVSHGIHSRYQAEVQEMKK